MTWKFKSTCSQTSWSTQKTLKLTFIFLTPSTQDHVVLRMFGGGAYINYFKLLHSLPRYTEENEGLHRKCTFPLLDT